MLLYKSFISSTTNICSIFVKLWAQAKLYQLCKSKLQKFVILKRRWRVRLITKEIPLELFLGHFKRHKFQEDREVATPVIAGYRILELERDYSEKPTCGGVLTMLSFHFFLLFWRPWFAACLSIFLRFHLAQWKNFRTGEISVACDIWKVIQLVLILKTI